MKIKILVTNSITDHDSHPYKTVVVSTEGVQSHNFADTTSWRAFVEGVRAVVKATGVEYEERGHVGGEAPKKAPRVRVRVKKAKKRS